MPHVFVAKCFLAITTFFVMFYQLMIVLTIGLVFHYGFVVKDSKKITEYCKNQAVIDAGPTVL